MAVTVIKDIRLFRSAVPNVDGSPLPDYIDDRAADVTAHRIAMKLREGGFSLGDFDHLYINFTPCLPDGEIRPAARSVSRETTWYRFYDVSVDDVSVDDVGVNDTGGVPTDRMIAAIERVLLEVFSTPETETLIRDSVRAAVTEGDRMLMRFKQKTNGSHTAVVYLRCTDDGRYVPLVCVYDADGQELARGEMAETVDLLSVGEVRLGAHKVTVLPRRNALTAGMVPFELTF